MGKFDSVNNPRAPSCRQACRAASFSASLSVAASPVPIMGVTVGGSDAAARETIEGGSGSAMMVALAVNLVNIRSSILRMIELT